MWGASKFQESGQTYINHDLFMETNDLGFTSRIRGNLGYVPTKGGHLGAKFCHGTCIVLLREPENPNTVLRGRRVP